MAPRTRSPVLTQPPDHSRRLAEVLDLIAPDLARVEESLAAQVTAFDPTVSSYVQYVLGGTGKRLRPSLALLAGGSTGGIHPKHVTLGVIVELIHIATLVHDDVLDEAQMRHGLPTANSRWGNEISVLVGDCLFAHALHLAATHASNQICRHISQATNTVCAGEIRQTQRRFDAELGLDQYLDMLRMKTGALFAVSCELGGLLNASPMPVVKGLREFGENLGIAYQIFDDCVDIFGQERTAGKSLGTDVKKGKLTLPFILLLQAASPGRRQELATRIFRADPEDRRELRKIVEGNGLVPRSRIAIENYIGQAESSLRAVPANTFTDALAALLRYLTQQSRRLLEAA